LRAELDNFRAQMRFAWKMLQNTVEELEPHNYSQATARSHVSAI